MVSLEILFVLLCFRTKTKWWKFCLSYYVSGQKPSGGATGHAKRAGRWPDLKFDDYTKNSSDLQSKFKNQPQNNSRA
jgi:hypothetical protein